MESAPALAPVREISKYASASSTIAVRSRVTAGRGPGGSDRHGLAGLSHVGNPQAFARANVRLFVKPASCNDKTRCSGGGVRPGRKSPRSSRFAPLQNNLDAEFRQQFFDPRVEFAFAEIARVPVVAQVNGVLKLVGGDDDVGGCRCGVRVRRASASSLRRYAGAIARDRARAITERLARKPGRRRCCRSRR